ncbi:MAG: hypothetical protein AUJ49_04310 [Desulfovibrionaceae bacterium CG1_02_65_16]|nr:MAG: hypothetical protein AUJ49_04310 [Desulfovibrionaceae bacterium CG1_02_65_16]
MIHCRGCGKEIHYTATSCPHCGCIQNASTPDQTGMGGMTFGEAIKTCLRKYATFEGRAARPEYWYFYLFCVILSILAGILKLPDSVSGLISLALFLPNISAVCRRLHDVNRSGWNQLWTLTVIGIIPVVYWLTRAGDAAPNRFGPAPNQPCLPDRPERANQTGQAG